MLAGDVPFAADSFGDLMLQHLQVPPRPLFELRPDLPPQWNDVVQIALAKERDDRFQSMQDFAAAVEATAEGRSITALTAGGVACVANIATLGAAPGATVAMPPGNAISAPPAMPSQPGTVAIPQVAAPAPAKSRLPLALALVGVVAAMVVVALLALRGGGDTVASSGANDADASSEEHTPSPSDAAPLATKPPDAAPIAARPPDAAPVAAAAPLDAAPKANITTTPRPPRPKKGTAELTIVVIPWAQVSVDGKSIGSTPKTIKLPAGKHVIKLRNKELDKDVTKRIRIKPGKDERIELTWE